MADASWWVPLASGVLGVAGALGGTWLTQRAALQRDEDAWSRQYDQQRIEFRRQRGEKLREIRSALYLDVMEFLENLDNRLAEEIDDRIRIDRIPEGPGRARLSARVSLYGDYSVLEGWKAALRASDAVDADWQEQAGEEVDADLVTAARKAIDDLRDLLRERAQSRLAGDVYDAMSRPLERQLRMNRRGRRTVD